MFAVLLLSIGLAQATAHAATYALSVSSSSSRSGAIALQGATLSGNAYIFTSLASQLTNFNPSGIAGVCFWLDNTAMSGTANHCESYAPYDLAGTAGDTSTSAANLWNTTAVANGTHTITQQVTLSSGGSEVDTSTFTVQNGTQSSSVYALSVSAGANHSGAVALQGTTLASSVYIFTGLASQLTNFTPSGIAGVCFWLDNTAMSGTANHCESYLPYDFAGSTGDTSNSTANPWNTTSIGNGTHTMTQKVTLSAGGSEVDTASFTVQNGTQSGSVYALSVSSSTNHSGAVALQGTTLAGSVYIFTSLASQLTNFYPSGVSAVCFWLDNISMSGTANHCESLAPYDFAGSVDSSSTSLANPWDTKQLPSGTHTITQQVTKSAVGTEVDTASFTIRNLSATLTASPTSIAPGQSSTLSWTTTGATSASIDQGIGAVPLSGTLTVSPTTTTKYTLTATGASGSVTSSATIYVGAAATHHYFYVLPDQNLYVFDLDNNFQEVKHINIPQAQGVRGLAAAPSTHTLYISYGGVGTVCNFPPCSLPPTSTGSLLAYDLLTDTIKWTKAFTFGVDSFAITPDGTKIYMPDGLLSGNGIWYVLDAATGNVLSSINTGMSGPHNTIVSLDGAYVFMAPGFSNFLVKASTATNTVSLNIGPTLSGNNIGVRPFTINGKHSLAFTTARYYLGFQVSNADTGQVLYTVPVSGFGTSVASSIPCHGISLSPDETRLYLIDNWYNYVHVFDVSKVPSAAPTQIANVPLVNLISGSVSPCLYDCYREGWLNHSSNGRYVFVGDSGDVIDTSTNTLANIPTPLRDALRNTKIFLEIDWQNGATVFTTTRYGLGFVTQ